jgi:hypothetical protein
LNCVPRSSRRDRGNRASRCAADKSSTTRQFSRETWRSVATATGYGDRRTRPFARRALSTLRPLRVAVRARKPWVRARFRQLGLKVCFTAGFLLEMRGSPGTLGDAAAARAKTAKHSPLTRVLQWSSPLLDRRKAVDNIDACG